MTDRLNDLFDVEMLRIYEEAKALGFSDNYFLRMIRRDLGGVGTAKALLSRPVTSALGTLAAMGRLDLTAEWLVLDPRFVSLFTADERQIAEERVGPWRPHA